MIDLIGAPPRRGGTSRDVGFSCTLEESARNSSLHFMRENEIPVSALGNIGFLNVALAVNYLQALLPILVARIRGGSEEARSGHETSL